MLKKERGVILLDLGGTYPVISFVKNYEIILKLEYDKKIDLYENIMRFLSILNKNRIIKKSETPKNIICSISGYVNNKIHSKIDYLNKIDIIKTKKMLYRRGYSLYYLNDFEVIGYAVLALKEKKKKFAKKIIKEKIKVNNNIKRISIIGPGTGLGMVNIYGSNVLSSEGGHSSFCPCEFRLLYDFLLRKYNKNSLENEELVSGNGIKNILDFLLFSPDHEKYILDKRSDFIINNKKNKQKNHAQDVYEDDEKLRESLYNGKEDVGKLISELFYKNQKAHITLRLMSEFLGNIAQNIIVDFIPTTGIYIAGGILRKNEFLFDFNDFKRGLFNTTNKNVIEIIKAIPVYLIKEENISLFGGEYYINNTFK